MNVDDIMTRQVITVTADQPVREAARVLAHHRISGVPVCDAGGEMIGLLTEYDLIARPDAHSVGDAMTRDVVTVQGSTSLDELRTLFVSRKFRRVPVLSGRKLVGIVSRGDLVREISLTWVCQVCGDTERGPSQPAACPRCGAPSGFTATVSPQVGEGADAPPPACPTCGQPLPRDRG